MFPSTRKNDKREREPKHKEECLQGKGKPRIRDCNENTIIGSNISRKWKESPTILEKEGTKMIQKTKGENKGGAPKGVWRRGDRGYPKENKQEVLFPNMIQHKIKRGDIKTQEDVRRLTNGKA